MCASSSLAILARSNFRLALLPVENSNYSDCKSAISGNQDPHKSLQPIRSSNSRSRLPRDQRSTTESTEIHRKENPNQLPLSVSFPGATPARGVGSFRGYPFVMIFLAGVIRPSSKSGASQRRTGKLSGASSQARRTLPARTSCGCGLAAGFPWLSVCDDLSCRGNKAIEFISQRLPTVASDIAPYRRFAGLHGISDFQVVPSTFEAWKRCQAVETVILQIPEAERQKG